jgi:hypothetical protein
VPSIDWQNRPTFQQVVNFTTHRPRATLKGGMLPVTGPPGVAYLTLLLLVTAGASRQLRRVAS